jgi:choline dehydrogenase-like flavoprotein
VNREQYSLVVVGTGFASTFFLTEYLRLAGPSERVLVLERGQRYSHAWKVQNRTSSAQRFDELVVNRTPQKQWVQNIAFGGGSCWTGNTPRFQPADFDIATRHGIGEDWPISYDELEPYYVRVEHAMQIAGAAGGPYRRSADYAQPAHALNAFDELLAEKYPGQYLPMPSARASTPAAGRGVCCAAGVCSVCPTDAKFEIATHYSTIYDDPRVTLSLESEVTRLDIEGNQVRGVVYEREGAEQTARCDLAVVGAHAIMTPFILLRSGLDDDALGRYLNEQIGRDVKIHLRGVKNFNGGQAVTGLGTMFLDREDRSERAGCLVEGWNVPWLRAERGRWTEVAFLKLVFEDQPDRENRVTVGSDPKRPELTYERVSDYLERGFESIPERVDELLEGLPVEDYAIEVMEGGGLGGSAHIQGTTRMGVDPSRSVVDRDLRHHRVRNLITVGGGVFPTCPAGNPTLSLSALAVRAAERCFA